MRRNATMKVLAATLLFAVHTASQACGPAGGTIEIAGSTTVQPISAAWGEAYQSKCNVTVITVGGGSTVGAYSVCGSKNGDNSPVDIGDMSRKWKSDEATTDFSGYKYDCLIGDFERSVIQIEVAIDGLSITMQAEGVGAQCVESLGGLTIHQLRWIYSNYSIAQLEETKWNNTALSNSDGDDSTHLWSELSADCASEEIKIAGPDQDSGTYVFFRETVLVDYEEGESFGGGATGYYNSADDSEIVTYVESDGAVIGYFGFAYYIQEGSLLYAAPIENYAGEFISPTVVSVTNATYFPLSRRLYMNLWSDPTSLANTGPFIQFGMSEVGATIVKETGYVPIPEALSELMIRRVKGNDEAKPTTGTGEGAATNGGATTASSSARFKVISLLAFSLYTVLFV